MRVFELASEWQEVRRQMPAGRTVGFVATMGALHEGHFSLVEKSVAECDLTVVSIFVNPAQFNDPEDLERYPRNLEADTRDLERRHVDYLILPDSETVYSDDYRYRVTESEFSAELCGNSRSGHFDGVLTVVMRLLNLVRPHRTYFGEKDFQQYMLIRDMVEAFFMDVEIVPCATVRDRSGVALSSRNRLLSPAGLECAAEFARILKNGRSAESIRRDLDRVPGIELDYVNQLYGRRFAAIYVEGVRLIDNVAV